MDFTINEDHEAISDDVPRLCQKFPGSYWREARPTRLAPVSQEMVVNYVAAHKLGFSRSY